MKVLKNLTDESLTKKIGDDVRTPGRLAWHITTAMNEMVSRTGLSFDSKNHEASIPATAKEIADEYKHSSENLVKELKAKWNDDSLKLEDNMYGEMWSKGKTLGVLITHQIHHRGQLTTLMRFIRIKSSGGLRTIERRMGCVWNAAAGVIENSSFAKFGMTFLITEMSSLQILFESKKILLFIFLHTYF